eukprot:CAMPEP_0182562816 /NCGR_PEP_ID=MMETSP1324-20130603/5099_1 /TAXON_ID=236786 /ORGANISM="Florenciella sp., Strain RCC1587" /LENGTH=99 /DNA_ID=CAMNT_0024775867 /DNA_START=24 /DNA_END=323 /DNA_ORIENTATION=-
MSALKALIPLADRVLVKRVVAASQTAGGIFLPDAATTKVNEGEVVSVGPGARTTAGDLIPMSLMTGDKVLLPEYGGNTVKMGDEEFNLFREAEILGKFE